MARYLRGDQFWELARDGMTITTVTGAIGEPGTPTVEKLATPALAATRERVLLNKHGREGWKLAKVAAAPVVVEEPAPPETVVLDARNPALESAIVEDPETDSQYEVYGDWLQQQGDPRGKAIALEVVTRGKTWGDKYHAQLNRFIEAHKDYLYGPFETGRGRSLTLHRGFVARVELLGGKLAATLSELFAHPARRFVTTIHIDAQGDDDCHQDQVTTRSADAACRGCGGPSRLVYESSDTHFRNASPRSSKSRHWSKLVPPGESRTTSPGSATRAAT